MEIPPTTRILISKKIAQRWLQKRSQIEYRFQIFGSSRGFYNLLRAFRDEQIRISGVKTITDLGIQEGFDSVTVWSSNYEALKSLQLWAESRGMETTGILV